MNEKIDLTKILKDCPKGTEFYSRCIGVAKFDSIDNTLKRIIVKNEREIVSYKENGVYYYADEDAEMDLFPSKDQRDWNKWQRPFIDGDIVYLDFGYYYKITIFKRQYRKFLCYHASLMDNNILSINTGNSDICTSYLKEIRFATEEEKLKLFQAIKDNGYKWNAEIKTLEKLIAPKFKVGDSVQSKTDNNDKFTITTIDDNKFYYGCGNGHEFMIPVVKQDNWELIPNKFDPKTLKPFDKVLVRYNSESNWCIAFFSHIDNDLKTFCHKFVTAGYMSFKQMIPYNEDTEHLLGTNNQAPEFYRY